MAAFTFGISIDGKLCAFHQTTFLCHDEDFNNGEDANQSFSVLCNSLNLLNLWLVC